ncbi:dipeptidase PepE [Serratia liquefaciens]
MKKLLLMSSSRKGSQGYLAHASEQIHGLLQHQRQHILFIPYAGVTFSFDEYESRVKPVFAELGYDLTSIHHMPDPVAAVNQAQAIAVGGGNTWALLRRMYDADIVTATRQRVESGVPYIGWSAGCNVACPTIRTTNDMPIIAPPTFDALGLVPFQINPHFISGKPQGHNGETREERLEEFLAINPQEGLVALPEGNALLVEDDRASMLGEAPGLAFTLQGVRELPVGGSFLLSTIKGK